MSVNTSSHNTIWLNQWDEEWELGRYDTSTGEKSSSASQIRCKNLIRVIGGESYYVSVGSGGAWAVFFDINGDILYRPLENQELDRSNNAYKVNGKTFTLPESCCYMAFYMTNNYGTTYNNDICINLHGARDGEYEAYVKNEYPLDSSLTLRGIPKLDADNKLYYDGDTYESSGKVTRKYGIVDLGTLNWTYDTTTQANPLFRSSSIPQAVSNKATLYICSKYVFVGSRGTVAASNQTIGRWNQSSAAHQVCVRDDSYTDAATFKTAMSGVYLLYELATPTEETADTFQTPQEMDKNGTEEYVDYAVVAGMRDVAIPVGHDTTYFELNNVNIKLGNIGTNVYPSYGLIINDSNGNYVFKADDEGNLEIRNKFTIKNDTDTGSIELSSSNDIQVIQLVDDNPITRVKIGNIGTTSSPNYGLVINDETGDPVLTTRDDGSLWLEKQLKVGNPNPEEGDPIYTVIGLDSDLDHGGKVINVNNGAFCVYADGYMEATGANSMPIILTKYFTSPDNATRVVRVNQEAISFDEYDTTTLPEETYYGGFSVISNDSHEVTISAQSRNNGFTLDQSGGALTGDWQVPYNSITFPSGTASISMSGNQVQLNGQWNVNGNLYLNGVQVATVPCLIEGTKIELYNGTSINVEDLQSGMIVKSYDVNSQKIIPAVVIDSYETGRSREFTSYVFDNGSYVICYGQHGFYHYGDGIIRNVEDMNFGISGVSADLSHPKYLRKYPLHIAGASKRRFNIITSNSLYFANGILMGSTPTQLYVYFNKYSDSILTKTLRITIDEICDEFNRHGYDLITNSDFYTEISKSSMDIARAKVRIKRYKERLEDTDYLTAKYTEGKLSEDAFELAKVERQHWRDLINQEEQIIADSTAEYESITTKYRKTSRTKREVYEYSWGLLNDKYDEFKEVFGEKSN